MRSNSGCIKAAATLAILLGAGAAQAALVHTAVTGTWDGLHTWNPGQNGDKLVESTRQAVDQEWLSTGWMEYDSVTGQLKNLYMTGTTWIGKWDARDQRREDAELRLAVQRHQPEPPAGSCASRLRPAGRRRLRDRGQRGLRSGLPEWPGHPEPAAGLHQGVHAGSVSPAGRLAGTFIPRSKLASAAR